MAKLTNKEQAILQNMKVLEISREEAEELYAFDNDEIDNDEVTEIENKVTAQVDKEQGRSSLEKVKHMKAKKKGDANKETIIEDIFAATDASENVFQAMPISATKMSFMDKDGNFYTVAITKHKKQPEGYVFSTQAELLAAAQASVEGIELVEVIV